MQASATDNSATRRRRLVYIVLPAYNEEKCLGRLLDRWNDGRRKGFYCLAANDLPIASVREVRASLEKIEAQGEEAGTGALPPGSKERALAAVRLIAEEAEKAGFELALRK